MPALTPTTPAVTPPVYVGPTLTPASPVPGNMGATGGAGTFTTFDYSVQINAIIYYLSLITHELEVSNFYAGSTNTPQSPAAMGKVQAAALNDISTTLASMLNNQNSITSALDSIQTAVGGLSGTVAEGVATNQIVASSTIKKHQKETAETEAAIKESGRTPQTISPGDFKTNVVNTINEASEISVQSKATGFVNQTISNSIEKTWNFTSGWVASTEAAQKIKKFWENEAKNKIFKPEDSVKKTTAETNTAKSKGLLGL